MKEKVNRLAVFTKGIIKENPNLVLLLGTCPTLATTSSAFNGMGMGIAAIAYLFLMFFSLALPSKAELSHMRTDEIEQILVTPWVMVGLYFILTVAELFISPLGLAFVSKVAPPHMQGLMQGFWLAATAVGNSLLFVGGLLYTSMPMWITWGVFVIACGGSMLVMLSMVKWLERVTR